jgi:hypothetical protein
LKIDLRTVEQLDDTDIDMPDLVRLRSPNTDGGLGWMNTLARSPPTAFTDKFGPGTGRGEDLADSLAIASQGTERHVPVLGRQHHLFDCGHLVAGELARACARTRRPVGEFADIFRSPPGVVLPRFEADDAQDGDQGKKGLGAGDCAKNSGFGLSLWETVSIEAKTGSTKQGEQEADDSSEHSCPLLPACTGIERVLLFLVERFRRDHWEEAPPSPAGNGGTWDLNVFGNGHSATMNDVFAQTMVVGASCSRRVRDCGCHPKRITGTWENLNDIEAAALANKKFKMSSFAASIRLSTAIFPVTID